MYNAYAVDGKCTITVFVEKPDGEIVSARHDVPAGHAFEATTDWGKRIWFTCYPPLGGKKIVPYTGESDG